MCCYTYYRITASESCVSNTVYKLLDTVCIVSVSSLHISRLFTVTTKLHHNIINIKFASNAIA